MSTRAHPSGLEIWFDFSCPYAYLASRRAAGVARAAGVPLAWRPMLLGGVFRGIGAGDGPMATLSPQKAAHNLADMHRWAEIFGVPFALPAAHPMRTVRALRALLALPEARWPAAIEGVYAAYWQRGEDITDDAVLARALGDGAAGALARADDPAIKDELRRRTDDAIALGIFGAPAWVVRRGEAPPILLWGQDRIAHLEAVLAGWNPDAEPPPGGPRPIGDRAQGFASPATLDVYFDVASPFSYLAMTQLPALARLTGVVPRLQPILLGALFRDIGQRDVPLFAMSPAKQRHVNLDMRRWARWWGVPFADPAKFPQRTIAAQRLCILAAERSADDGMRLADRLGRAMWAERRDVEDADTLRGLLADAGLPPDWVERTREPAVKQALIDRTAVARAAGVFGVPTFVVDGRHLFWGQDRLELVVRALGGWRPAHG